MISSVRMRLNDCETSGSAALKNKQNSIPYYKNKNGNDQVSFSGDKIRKTLLGTGVGNKVRTIAAFVAGGFTGASIQKVALENGKSIAEHMQSIGHSLQKIGSDVVHIIQNFNPF